MRKRREQLNADLTPLIDIVFLLLIFFLVSSVFKKEELALLLNLPKTDNLSESVEKKQLSLELSINELALNNEVMTFEEFDEKLAIVKNKRIPVVVRIDEKVQYQRLMKAFDILQKNELNNLMLVSKNNANKK